ncbi:MAG: hypothetical protein J6A75_11950 [Lachnospiraceae bacterium]|nr:hypothetical protein [Lachnospiraceae bacterium]
MIKKSPKKYLIFLLVIELLFVTYAINRYCQNYENGKPIELTAENFSSRQGEFIDNSHYIDSVNYTVTPGTFTYGPYIKTSKGTYLITLYYQTDTNDNTCYIHSNNLSYSQLKTPYRVSLPADKNSVTFSAVLTQGIEDFELITEYCGTGALRIEKMTLTKTPYFYIRNILITLAGCLFALLIFYFYVANTATRKNILFLTLITLASCYPLFVDYLTSGHDLPFHMIRIEGIAQGLSQGTFPVKIHPFWANGYGYAAGVFYGDALLYFPALLRIAGFSLQESYKAYIAAINLATVLIAWKCFKKIFNSNHAGLIACLLYTLAPYRLSNVYLRHSVGEYTALTFLPLVLYGFYLVFTEDYKKKGYWKHAIPIALGLTGIVQSHVLSCEMVAIFILLVCLIMIGKTCHIRVFLTLSLAAFTTVLINLGFLVPFLSYFGGDFVMNSPDWNSTPIQASGAYPAQLFPVFQNGVGSSNAYEMAGEMPLGVGFTLLLGLLLFFYLRFCKTPADTSAPNSSTLSKFAMFSALLSVLALYMATNLFPWNAIANLGEVLKKLIYNLQFPWRFLTIATLFLVIVTAFALQLAKKQLSKEMYVCALGTILCFFVISTSWFYYDLLNRGTVYRPYEAVDLNSMALGSEEYLPTDTDIYLLTQTTPMPSDGVEIQSFQKNGTNIWLHITNPNKNSYVELPLLYYKGYTAVSNDMKLNLSKGTNNVIRLEVPANFEGKVSVYFEEPLYWRIAELISAISFLCIITGLLITALKTHYIKVKV